MRRLRFMPSLPPNRHLIGNAECPAVRRLEPETRAASDGSWATFGPVENSLKRASCRA
jgi:hypothetical protein